VTWASSRLQRGPYTGRSAKPAGLVSGWTKPRLRVPPTLYRNIVIVVGG